LSQYQKLFQNSLTFNLAGMMLLLALSVGALKVSDPARLSEVYSNNSLESWCKGVGCVQPFTPQSCLSWCDWNADKQTDAEARGAFSSDKWGTAQKKMTDFGLFYDGSNACVTVALNFNANAKTYDAKKLIFPGGDAEKKLGTTEIQCNRCYLAAQNYFRLSRKTATSVNVDFYPYTAAWGGETQASTTNKPCDSAKIINSFVIASTQSTTDFSKCVTRKNVQLSQVKIGLKGLIWPKTCAAAAAGESVRKANSYIYIPGKICDVSQDAIAALTDSNAADEAACVAACTAALAECTVAIWDVDNVNGGKKPCRFSKTCVPSTLNHLKDEAGTNVWWQAP